MGLWNLFRQDRRPAEAPPASAPPARRPGWSDLPPLQRSVAAPALVTAPSRFAADLVSWQNPSMRTVIGHAVSADAPSGSGEGLAEPAAAATRDEPLPEPGVQRSWPPLHGPAGQRPVSLTATSAEVQPDVRPTTGQEPGLVRVAPARDVSAESLTSARGAEPAPLRLALPAVQRQVAASTIDASERVEPGPEAPDSADVDPEPPEPAVAEAPPVQRSIEPSAPEPAPPAIPAARRLGLGAPLPHRVDGPLPREDRDGVGSPPTATTPVQRTLGAPLPSPGHPARPVQPGALTPAPPTGPPTGPTGAASTDVPVVPVLAARPPMIQLPGADTRSPEPTAPPPLPPAPNPSAVPVAAGNPPVAAPPVASPAPVAPMAAQRAAAPAPPVVVLQRTPVPPALPVVGLVWERAIEPTVDHPDRSEAAPGGLTMPPAAPWSGAPPTGPGLADRPRAAVSRQGQPATPSRAVPHVQRQLAGTPAPPAARPPTETVIHHPELRLAAPPAPAPAQPEFEQVTVTAMAPAPDASNGFVVQRVDAPAAEPPVAEPPAPAAAPAAPATAATGAAAGAAAGGSSSPTEVDALVRKLYDPIVRRIKAELRQDRERAGRALDLRH